MTLAIAMGFQYFAIATCLGQWLSYVMEKQFEPLLEVTDFVLHLKCVFIAKSIETNCVYFREVVLW